MISNAVVGESFRIEPIPGSSWWGRVRHWFFRQVYGTPSVRMKVLEAEMHYLGVLIESQGMMVAIEQEQEWNAVPATAENIEREFGDGSFLDAARGREGHL